MIVAADDVVFPSVAAATIATKAKSPAEATKQIALSVSENRKAVQT